MEFSRYGGLCYSIDVMYPDAKVEMINQFKYAGLSMTYPFGIHDYCERAYYSTQHQCPKRLAWVLDHINNPPEKQSNELTEFYKAWYSWAIEENIKENNQG